MKKKLLNIAEVAEVLGVKEHRVYALARSNLLPIVRIGRQIRVEEGRLQEWIDQGGSSLQDGTEKSK